MDIVDKRSHGKQKDRDNNSVPMARISNFFSKLNVISISNFHDIVKECQKISYNSPTIRTLV